LYVGAVALFGATGLARGGLGLGSATSARYVYVAVALLLPGLSSDRLTASLTLQFRVVPDGGTANC